MRLPLALLVLATAGAPLRGQVEPRTLEPEPVDGQRAWTSVEREGFVRAWALDPEGSLASVERALADPRWPRRAAALEALERGLACGAWLRAPDGWRERLEPRVVELATAPDSRCAAPALGALAQWPRELDATQVTGWALALADHPLPEVRLALVRLLRRHAPGEGGWLEPMIESAVGAADPRLRAGARGLVAGRLGREPELLGALLDDERLGPQELLDLVLDLEREPPTEADLDSLAAVLRAREDAAGWLALLEALRLRWFARGDAARLASGWDEHPELTDGRRPLLLRAARAARTIPDGRVPLAEQLLGEARRRLDLDPKADVQALLSGATEAAAPAEIARLLAGWPARDFGHAELVWLELRGREQRWRLEDLAPWLAHDRHRDLRLRVVQTVSGALFDRDDPGAGRALVRALDDPDPAVVRVAWEALARSTDPTPWLGDLHRAWAWQDEGTRVEWLSELPRREPLPAFRGDLLALAAAGGRGRGAALELLSRLRDDEEVRERVRAWLEESLGTFLLADGDGRRAAELDVIGLVRAWNRLAGASGTDDLVGLLARLGSASDEIGKVAVAALGRSSPGRSQLPRLLDPEAPRRLRIEAELWLAPQGVQAAVLGLRADWAVCDWELKNRALRALASLDDSASFQFLSEVARDRDQDLEHRALALEVLAGRDVERELEPLRALLTDLVRAPGDPDTGHAALLALERVAGPAQLELLLARLVELEAQLTAGAGDPRIGSERALDERETLLGILGRAGRDDPSLLAAWLRRPYASAASDLYGRFRGERSTATTFAWSGEIAFASALARRERLLAALEASGPWWTLDARLLGALGEAAWAAGDSSAARELMRASSVGIAGEAPVHDGPGLALVWRHRLLAIAERERDWRVFEELAQELFESWRRREVSERGWSTELGDFLPAEGRDPVARLRSARHQARAWAALDGGEREAAVRAAARAREQLGFSAPARAAQERLEAALAAGR